MKPVFFIDYDNTIFSHRTWSVPESALQALADLKASGYPVVLASGRAFRSTSLPEEFKGRFIPDCLVSSNGALIETEGRLIWEKYFDPDLQTRILDFVTERGYCLLAGENGKWYTSSVERFLSVASNKQRQIMPEGGEGFRALYHKKLPSFFLADTVDAMQDIEKHFPEVKLLYMGDEMGGADIIPKENGKVSGASRILEYLHADWSDVIAIGDSMNDIELIKAAAIGIAMGNAMPEVQKAAVYVAKDIDENGLADAIRYARNRIETSAV